MSSNCKIMQMIISGSNLFGQWFSNEEIFKKFTAIKLPKTVEDNQHMTPILVHISWSYNIFTVNKRFFIAGAFASEDNVFQPMRLPAELEGANSDVLSVIGNDDFVLILDKRNNTFWKLNLERTMVWEWEKLPNIHNVQEVETLETRREEDAEGKSDVGPVKRVKRIDPIIKAVTKDNNYICLTESGVVYDVNSKIDTSMEKERICDVDCGFEHMVALTTGGKIYTWGANRRCQLGLGDLKSRAEPTHVFALEDIKIVKIAAGGWHTLALSEDGIVYSWGWNNTGQLGIHEQHTDGSPSTAIPVVVDLYDYKGKSIDTKVKNIGCGNRHSALIDEANTIWTTGYNNYGQVGLDPKTVPIQWSFRRVICSKTNCNLVCGPWVTALTNTR